MLSFGEPMVTSIHPREIHCRKGSKTRFFDITRVLLKKTGKTLRNIDPWNILHLPVKWLGRPMSRTKVGIRIAPDFGRVGELHREFESRFRSLALRCCEINPKNSDDPIV